MKRFPAQSITTLKLILFSSQCKGLTSTQALRSRIYSSALQRYTRERGHPKTLQAILSVNVNRLTRTIIEVDEARSLISLGPKHQIGRAHV